jgi:hypothetical protein
MPTISLAGALLALGSPTDNVPWDWPQWQQMTGIEVALYLPRAVDNLPANWDAQIQSAVSAFALNFSNLSDADRVEYIKNQKDNDAEGRKAWISFVNNGWNKTWKIHDVVNRILLEYQVHPYAVMRRMGTKTVSQHCERSAYTHPSEASRYCRCPNSCGKLSTCRCSIWRRRIRLEQSISFHSCSQICGRRYSSNMAPLSKELGARNQPHPNAPQGRGGIVE